MSHRPPLPTSPSRSALHPRAWLRGAVFGALGLATVAALALAAVELGWFRPPFPPLGRSLAWWIGNPAPAYNFSEVVRGRLYRSGRPDDALLRHARDTHGIARLVSLSGPTPAHETARALGMEVFVFAWSGRSLPPDAELERVLDLLDDGEPVWVHCEHGMDRTGAAIAAYRVRRQRWGTDRALAEMTRHRFEPGARAPLEPDLRALLRAS